MKKNLLSFLMFALSAALLFAGATGESGTGAAGVSELTYWTDNPALTGDEPLYDIVEEEAQVTLLVTGVPESDYGTKLQLAAAADEMPDVMGRIPDSSVLTLGAQGLLLPLKDVTRQKAPNLWKAIEERGLESAMPAQSGLFGDGTGEFWMIPRFGYNGTANTPSFRKDWFDETGLGMPTSPDEVYTLLKAVKKNHADSIPLYLRSGGWAMSLLNTWFHIKAGTPMGGYEEASAEYKNAMKFMAKLYAEDLIDNEWPTASEESLKQAYNAGKVFMEWGFGAFWQGRLTAFLDERGVTMDDYQKGQASFAAAKEFNKKYGEVMVLMPWFSTDPGGKVVVLTNTRGGFEDSGTSFNADIEDVDAAMRLIDWIFQPDGSAHYTSQYGKKGVGWDFDAEGNGRPLDTRDSDWRGDGAFMMMPDIMRILGVPHYHVFQEMDRALGRNGLMETRDVYAFSNDKDRQRRNDLRAQIDPIVSEWRLKFATGQVDVDAGWDDYVAALKSAGLDELVKIQKDNLVRGVPHIQQIPLP